MKKKRCVLGAAVLVAVLLMLSGVAQSAMWVGAQLGGNGVPSTSMSVDGRGISRSENTKTYPSVIGGATIGYDFVNAGFGAYAWPDWMKYFSFAMDITYNHLNSRQGTGAFAVLAPNSKVNGYEFAWTFLFMAHYGFLPDSEVPTGRINPYIGVGPAILWSGVDFKVKSGSGDSRFSGDFGASAVNIALVVEPGIRWMCFKNVSVDTFMRYRYAQPAWTADDITIKATALHQLAFMVRANLHF